MNLKTYLSYSLLAGSLIFGSACSNSRGSLTEESSVTGYELGEDVPGAYTATSAEVLNAKAEFRERLNASLDRVDQQIESLEDEAKNQSASLQETYQQTIDELDVQRERLVDQYRTLDEATTRSWEEVQQEIEGVMQDVEQKMTTLVADLKQEVE